MSANLKKDILEAANLYKNEAAANLRFKHGDEAFETTMWAESMNNQFCISLETYRRYQGQWCSVIKLSVDEAKALQKQLTIFIHNATIDVKTKDVVDFGDPIIVGSL